MENIKTEGNLDNIAATTPSDNPVAPMNQDQNNTVFGKMISSASSLSLNSIKTQEWILKRRETMKPWTEFMNFSKLKKPNGVTQCGSRLIKNIEHFQTNYMCVFIILAVYCILTSPLLLFAFMGLAGGCYIIHLKNKDNQLRIMGKELSVAQLYAVAGMCSIPLFLLAGAGSAVFWIIGASSVLICLHASFYAREEPEDPFLAQMNIV